MEKGAHQLGECSLGVVDDNGFARLAQEKESQSKQAQHEAEAKKELSESERKLLPLDGEKERKIKPYKPIQKCARTASLAKIDQIAEHFLGKDRALPTLEEFEKTTSMLRSRLGVASADKVVNEKRKLSVMDDIDVFSGIVSASKRREIKKRTGHTGSNERCRQAAQAVH
uniref:Uncharacterized protein n=1 Tax=Ditylenchus dipsaci TaxID=166011 RepID=A0A915EDI6_9BILA